MFPKAVVSIPVLHLLDYLKPLFPMSKLKGLELFRLILSDTTQEILLQPVEWNMKTK